MPRNGTWTDIITDFVSYTEAEPATDIHRLWAGIALVAGALERRVWAPVGDLQTFPNLYILLVAPPGVGKSIIYRVRDLWNETVELGTSSPAFRLSPESVTRASLIDALGASKNSRITASGTVYFSSLLVPSEEFEVILPTYDSSFISILNSIFGNPHFHRETRRTGPVREIIIEYPSLNIIGGATPAYFTAHFPDEAWNTGLIRRIIMVYSAEAPVKDIFTANPDKSNLRHRLLDHLCQLTALFGPAKWADDAYQELRHWHLNGQAPVPSHSKLVNYIRSRTQFLIKLALISGVSRTGFPKIESIDVSRAMRWLFEVEALMPDIFRAMTGKSDMAILQELHFFAEALGLKHRGPIQSASLLEFLAARAPSEKVQKLLEVAEKTNIIARVAGTLDQWLPRPSNMHQPE